PDYREIPTTIAGGTRAWRCEDIRPRVQHLHQVISFADIGHAQDDRLLCQVEPGGGVERVGVWTDHVSHRVVGKFSYVDELVYWSLVRAGLRNGSHHLTSDIHQYQRVAEDIGFDGDLRRFACGYNLFRFHEKYLLTTCVKQYRAP